jgi:E3 ubiquitin-protein ligase synoviolin
MYLLTNTRYSLNLHSRRTVLEEGGTQPATPPNHGAPEVRQNAQPQPPAGGENAVPAARGAPGGNPGGLVGQLLRAQAAQDQAPGTVPVAPQGPSEPAQTAVVIQYQIQFQPQPPELPRTQPIPNGQPQPPFLRQIHPNPTYDFVVNHPPDSSNGAVSGQQSPPGTSTPTQAAAQAALQRLSSAKSVSSPSQPSTTREDVPHTIPLQTFDQSAWSDVIPQSSITPRSSILSSDDALAPPQLPPTLTEHQLSVLDHLTREAIDERLRVLERVSSTIYQSIEDLMRVRSALPSNPESARTTSSESDEVQRSDLAT